VPPQDRQALIAFLVHVHGFIGEGLGRHGGELSSLAVAELQEQWMSQESRVSRASEALRSEAGVADERLDEVGLTGAELAFKLRLYYDAVEGYGSRATPTRFSDVLSAADITLGSLALILPVVDGFKEFKEVVEFIFSWGRGWIRRMLRNRRR
jgi:hypothetical protein